MDIDVSQLPILAVQAIVVRHEEVRVLQDGTPIATVVPTQRPVFRSHKALREHIGSLGSTFADEVRAERDPVARG